MAYGVGWGTTSPSVQIGTVASGQPALTNVAYLTVGGIEAEISYVGLSPGSAGLYQVNFTVPSGLAAGNQPLVLTLSISSPQPRTPLLSWRTKHRAA